MLSARVRANKPVAVLHEEPSPALCHAALLDLQPQGQLVATLHVAGHIVCDRALCFYIWIRLRFMM